MRWDDEELNDDQKGEGGEEGKGGVGGKIRFRYKDAASLEPRDDQLPPNEIRRLLAIQRELHKQRVDKQKQTRNERKALKEKKVQLQTQYRHGSGFQGGSNKFKKHPITNKAQFSGMDSQVNAIPTELVSENNLELQLRLEKRFELQLMPKFNPQPKPPGSY